MSEVANIVPAGIDKTIASMNSGTSRVFSTIAGTSDEDALRLLVAIENAEPVADNLNKPIKVVDFIIQPVELVNEDSGVVEEQPRITLVDEDGASYNATSKPLLRSFELLLKVYGEDTPTGRKLRKPVDVYFIREGQGTRKYFVLKYGVPKSGK